MTENVRIKIPQLCINAHPEQLRSTKAYIQHCDREMRQRCDSQPCRQLCCSEAESQFPVPVMMKSTYKSTQYVSSAALVCPAFLSTRGTSKVLCELSREVVVSKIGSATMQQRNWIA
jgi:hypothetical protein